MKKTSVKGVLILFLTAFIWGSSFVAQSIGMEHVEAFTYNGIRTLMGAAVLLPFVWIETRRASRAADPARREEHPAKIKRTVFSGAKLGLALCLASNLQQFAFKYTTSGKISFITALYMLFVPVVSLFLGKRPRLPVWGAVALGGLGLWFLSIPAGGFTAVNRGDALALACAFVYAIQILMVDKYVTDCAPITLACVQFAVSGAISCVLMLLFETPALSGIRAAIWPLLYSGVLSCGVAYTLQIVGQKYAESTVASLIMCAESVFGVLSAAVVLHEIPTGREILGCALMFTAIIAAQLAGREKKKPA